MELARIFDRAGVHLVPSMSTAGLPFERYLEMVVALCDTVSSDLPIMANKRDLSGAQALELREAGARAAYHAVRLREGRLTRIMPRHRRQTIRNLLSAGLALMTGVKPVFDGISREEIASRICEIPAMHP